MLSLITHKRDGGELDRRQIETFVAAVCGDRVPDYQISAFLMAVFFNGMNGGEISTLTRAMAESGATYSWDHLDRPTADKHSTGGVGDKLSLIIAPLVAAMGGAVPMLSGRGLGFTGGTLDKLESIPGFNTSLNETQFRRQIADLGCAFIGQSEGIAPADKRLYALRDVTGTVESLPLIVSSILSKKIAAGPGALVIDLKVGRGAFMPTLARARELGVALRETALSFQRRCTVIYTAMDAPLGRAVGNGPEVRESLEVLAGGGPDDIRQLSLVLAAEMVLLAGLASTPAAALAQATETLERGQGLALFGEIVTTQGGQLSLEQKGWGLPAAPCRRSLVAEGEGLLLPPNARAVGELTVDLGAGRRVASDEVDPRAGITFTRSWGELISRGEEIAVIEGGDRTRVERVVEGLRSVISLGPEMPVVAAPILGIDDEKGFRPWSDR